MQEIDDSALLREYAEKASEEAFAALVARHVNKVYSVALRHARNPHQAEEITQAVFVILARKATKLGPRVIVSGWLYQTARLAALTSIRGEIRRTHREQEASVQNLTDETESSTWLQIAPLLDTAMAGLSEKDRHAIVLRFFDGKTIREVAVELGASEDAAKMRVNRAVDKLRAYFARHGVSHSGEVLTATITAHSVQVAPAALAKSVTALAVAKGAAVSTPTLALIHGALKLMAWTKAKTAAVTAAVAILAVGTTTVVIHAVRAANPDLQGAWEGVMHLDDPGVAQGQLAATHIVLKLAKTGEGYHATVDLIEQGRKDIPIEKVIYKYPSLQLEWRPKQVWNLTVQPGAKSMIWGDHSIHFIQPDPVELTRTPTPDQVPELLADGDFSPRPGSDLQGYWETAIGAGPDALPVNFKISEQADGTFRAELESRMQGAGPRPVTVIYQRPAVQLVMASGTGMFRGEINSAHTELSGEWVRDGQSLPAIVKRAEYHDESVQDLIKDYNFTNQNDVQGHWRGAWKFNDVPVREALDIAKEPDGSYSATISNPDALSDNAPIPVSLIQCDPPRLRVTCKWAGVGFDGELKNGKLVGAWQQSGHGFDVAFQR